MTVIAEREFARTIADGYLRATAKLEHLQGNTHPHFIVTGELWQSKGWYENGQDGRLHECGSLHGRILKAFPKLAPIVALHLSDENGVPRHAVDNGWYWYERDRETAARYLRVAPEDLPEGMDREAFVAFIDLQRPRWRTEALQAFAFLKAP